MDSPQETLMCRVLCASDDWAWVAAAADKGAIDAGAVVLILQLTLIRSGWAA